MSETVSKAVRLEVKIDGTSEISRPDGEAPLVLRDGGGVQLVRVDKAIDAPDAFELRVNVLRDQTLMAIDEDLEGKSVEVALGLGARPTRVFKGEICYIEPNFAAGGAESFLSIGGYDRSHRLTRGSQARTWGDGVEASEKYSDVAGDVIARSASQDSSKTSDGLSSDKLDATSARFDYVPQLAQSDYEFLRSMGMDASRPLSADTSEDDSKVSFQKVRSSGSPVLTICRDKVEGDPAQLATNCRLRLSTVQQYAKVVVRGWDPKQKKALVGVAEEADQRFDGTKGKERTGRAMYGGADKGRVYQVFDHPVTSQDEADAVAQAIFNRLAMDFVTGEVETKGFPGVNPGDLIDLKGFGNRFSGSYLVQGVVHEVSRYEGYRTTLRVARNAAPDP